MFRGNLWAFARASVLFSGVVVIAGCGQAETPAEKAPLSAQNTAAPSPPITAPVAVPAPAPIYIPRGDTSTWRVYKEKWSVADEREYGDFVTRIGESGCSSVNRCMWDPANPYAGTNPKGVTFYADCADLPYFLRAYFAWKKGLPFTYINAVSPKGSTSDIRYTLSGNRISSRRVITGGSGSGMSVLSWLRGNISSAMYRLHPADQDTDLYPIKIDRKALRPGSVLYDPNGHLAVVYKVEDDGRVRFIDAHPDNSLTHATYGRKFVRARPSMGSGFKNWRPFTLIGATKTESGEFVGGTVSFVANKDLEDYSTEQFYGNNENPPKDSNWSSGGFNIAGEPYEYYDYVRTQMAGGSLTYHPVVELRNMMRTNCEDIKYRAEAVDLAIRAGIQNKPQIQQLPRNIYGTEGEWEEFSTPSRDARLKTAFKEVRDQIERLVNEHRLGSKRVIYEGKNLIADLLAAYDQEALACSINYSRTDGVSTALGYEEVRKRLFLISFDPYHCVERRWGAYAPAELASCRDGADKTAWYQAEQYLRNQIDRTYEARMDHGLAALRSPGGEGKGVPVAPDVDLRAYLARELANPSKPIPPPVSAVPTAGAPTKPVTVAKPAVAPKPAQTAAKPAAKPADVRPTEVRHTTADDGVGFNVAPERWRSPLDAPYDPSKAKPLPTNKLTAPEPPAAPIPVGHIPADGQASPGTVVTTPPPGQGAGAQNPKHK
jgi:hypothetical protein